MVRSAEIVEKIQHVLSEEEWLLVEVPFLELNSQQMRKGRKTLISQINNILIETSFKNNRPNLLLALPEIQENNIDDLFPRIVRQYIATKRNDWLEIIYSISEKFGKKSNQSRVFAMVARELIDAGVSGRNPALIESGMLLLNRIGFRKYRSDIMIDVIPLLIVWAVRINDKTLLCKSLSIIDEIGDISKRSVIHAELARALATIAIQKQDRTVYFYSIRSAAEIHQKIRRQTCIASIIELGAKSIFYRKMADIPRFIDNFTGISMEAQLELISALTAQLLEQIRDKEQILSILQSLSKTRPSATSTIVIELLKKAEQSGESWYLSSAQELQRQVSGSSSYPLREIIHAATAVATATGTMQVLSDLIPDIEKNSSTIGVSRTYLQFSQIMLSSGDFESALEMFGRIRNDTENLPQYADMLTDLLKAGFLNDCIHVVKEGLLKNLDETIVNNAVNRAAVELARETTLTNIVTHIHSMNNLVLLHPQHDHLFYECITILGDRGFLNIHDPGILIRLTESISEQGIKERTISSILIRIAKMGVQLKNRDYLQRAVGLTCLIDGQSTRSATLSVIIDETALLAAREGDLDLLLRMRTWSTSLLEAELAMYAMANIIEGIIKYAIDRKSSDALEEAYVIAKEVNDPSLRLQLLERIAENFVRNGCNILNESSSVAADDFCAAKRSFSRGIDIIRQDIKSPQESLRIAAIIDIIVTYSKSGRNQDFIIPLAMYAAEIRNTFERDAMMARIISSVQTDVIYPGSSDPYEIMAFHLQRSVRGKEDPDVIGLISRIIRMISDPFVRLSELTVFAESLIRSQDTSRAKRILEEVTADLKDLPSGEQKVLLLADLAILYCRIDTSTASECLLDGIVRLEVVEPDRQAVTRRQVVYAIARLNTVQPESRWVGIALKVAEDIADPLEYINALIAVYSMSRGDKTRENKLLLCITDAVEKISSPYEKVSTLLEIIPLAIQNSEGDAAKRLLMKAEALTKKINIPFIADRMRDKIARIYLVLAEKNADMNYRESAIAVIRTISADEIRQNHLMKAGYPETYEVPPHYLRIKALSEKMIENGIHQNQVTVLERLVLTITDRGREALFFSDLAIFFKRAKEGKIASRMLGNAIKKARIIRPLSRRSFILCDIALRLHAAGCERTAQDILDHAIDAATNIRESSLRDEVFDELGLAIRTMQEIKR